jgi:hypothetical protein
MALFWSIALLGFLCALCTANDSSYYFKHWCGHGLEWLDDSQCQKKFPSSFDRNWVCPILSTSKTTSGYSPDTGKFADFHINTTYLGSLLVNNTNACVILVKRPAGGPPVYKHFCASGDDKNAFETW